MTKILGISLFYCLIPICLFAQNGRVVSGIVKDSSGSTLPGVTLKLVSTHDSLVTSTDAKGNFNFSGVKELQFSLILDYIGFQTLKRRYSLNPGNAPALLAPIILNQVTTNLKGVTVVDAIPIKIKEDTVEYNAAAYKVRDNAPVEDVLRKLPGVDVDKDGNVTAQGKSVTKVRVNGKDFFGGDLKTATKNIPADMVQNYQIVDDYGDQANLTGIKTGEPDKILNITIRPDRNFGYFGQATVGDGIDDLPQKFGTKNENRYIAGINAYKFKGNQQLAILGNLNNTNTNLFNFAGGGGRGLGLGRGGRGGGGGGSNANGITTARSLGLNYRDSWGKKITVYGSLSLADNLLFTQSTSLQNNISIGNQSLNQSNTLENDVNQNVRFNYNLEFKPDTINYLKVIPNFSFSGQTANQSGNNQLTNNGKIYSDYTLLSSGRSSSPNFGINALFNHRFNKPGRNFSINIGAGTYHNYQFQNPIYTYLAGRPSAPANQTILTTSKTDSLGGNISYIEPIAKKKYLELNYGLHTASTATDKSTDTLNGFGLNDFYALLSNRYNFTFTLNRLGINLRGIEKKYNYTLGIAFQPTLLDGFSATTGLRTRVNTYNWAPSFRYTYNFSRNQILSVNYNAGSNQPAFSVLQPVIDFSNATYPVQGNPNLKPEFSSNFSVRYNKFDIASGKVFFSNISLNLTDNKIVSNTINYPRIYSLDPKLARTILTQYLNTNGYYSASGFYIFSKPWLKRKYTLILNGNLNYSQNISFISNFDSINNAFFSQKNFNRNLVLSQGARFRYNIDEIIDAELNSSYALNHGSNTVSTANFNNNFQTLIFGVSGKNYILKDWTLSYDYSKTLYIGYTGSTNPSILNAYLERRFLKNNIATLRFSAYDLFNQNTGYSSTVTGSSTTQTNTNRLGRYYLLSFTLKVQKFSGKRPEGLPGNNRFPGGRGFDRGPGG